MTQEWTIPLNIRVSIEFAGEHSSVPAIIPSSTTPEGPKPDAGDYYDKFSLSSLAERNFEWRKALSLALSSKLVYSSGREVEYVGRTRWSLRTCEFLEADDTKCFVGSTDHVIVVAFRGTESLGDWMSNLNTIATTREYLNTRVGLHRGFLGAFQVVQRQIEDTLSRLGSKPILLAGHSLGGALAVIAAAEWTGRFDVKAVQTFGQPAVGKTNFADFINGRYSHRYHRFVNDDDVVPRVPPWFSHCGALIRFNKHGGLEGLAHAEETEAAALDDDSNDTPVINESQFNLMRAHLLQEKVARGGAPLGEQAVERAANAAGVKEPEPNLEGFPSISDHSMDIYVAKIARQAGF